MAKTIKNNESVALEKFLETQTKCICEIIRKLEKMTGCSERNLGGEKWISNSIRPQGMTFDYVIKKVGEQDEEISYLSERLDDLEEIQDELDNERLEQMENDIDWLHRMVTDLLRRGR